MFSPCCLLIQLLYELYCSPRSFCSSELCCFCSLLWDFMRSRCTLSHFLRMCRLSISGGDENSWLHPRSLFAKRVNLEPLAADKSLQTAGKCLAAACVMNLESALRLHRKRVCALRSSGLLRCPAAGRCTERCPGRCTEPCRDCSCGVVHGCCVCSGSIVASRFDIPLRSCNSRVSTCVSCVCSLRSHRRFGILDRQTEHFGQLARLCATA